MPTQALTYLLPPAAAFPVATAGLILDCFRDRLPDLSGLTLVTPGPGLFQPLRHALAQAAGGPLLSPRCVTLDQLAAPQHAVASPLACQLRLAEALARFRFLFPAQTPLRVAESLYQLFEELDSQGLEWTEDEATWVQGLERAYGARRPLAALSREAQIVHRLRRAFREELGEQAPSLARNRSLQQSLQAWPAGQPLIFAGFDELGGAEITALRPVLARSDTLWIAQGRLQGRDGESVVRLLQQLDLQATVIPPKTDGRSRLLDAAFASTGSGTAGQRAQAVAGEADTQGLRVIDARDPEHAAQCIDLAIREAIQASLQRIVVVCDDRRLARRLRARLERAGFSLADRGGWALSTSRAAATLDAWLRCASSDFPTPALLDLLKSGFVQLETVSGNDWATALEPRAYAGAIAGGAARWREAMQSAEERRRWQQIEQAAAGAIRGGHPPAAEHADALLHSLDAIGLTPSLAADAAGERLLLRLRELREALAGTGLRLHAAAFRALLDRCLEDSHFTLPSEYQGIELLTLAQTSGLQADCILVADAGPALMQTGTPSAFFNSAVRRELGLPGPAERQALALKRLRHLLSAAPQVCLVVAPAAAGEPASLAPPLQLLSAFAQAAGCPLSRDTALAQRARLAEIAADSPLPAATAAPAPAASPALLERALSAHGHQVLIDCPYAFHARYALGLERLEDYDAPSDARDHGERVHRVLHAFEQAQPGLPPPYTGPRTPAYRGEIEAHLQMLADAVFAADVAARPLGRFGRLAFDAALPWLAQMLIEHGHATVQVEAELSTARDGWQLRGRIDRLEDDGGHQTIIDYKTGTSPTISDIHDGEAVQLPHYALMQPAATALEYWDLKNHKPIRFAGDNLALLLPQMAARLGTIADAIRHGTSLPAHGAAAICERCDFYGVCRRGDWSGERA